MGEVETVEVRTFSDYATLVEKRFVKDGFIFRGQASSDWSLLPKIARLNMRGRPVVAEREMFIEFQRRARPHLKEQPRSEWEWLAIAQHHGAATRLLDWTTNVLGALWFAVQSEGSEVGSDASNPTPSGVVWAYRPSRSEVVSSNGRPGSDGPFDGTKTCVYYPPFVSERIAAQSGVFTVHKHQSKTATFVPLEEMRERQRRLLKIVIPRESFSALRYFLEWCGVNAASMFPGLEGVGKHAQWLHSYARDERPRTSLSRIAGVKPRRLPIR